VHVRKQQQVAAIAALLSMGSVAGAWAQSDASGDELAPATTQTSPREVDVKNAMTCRAHGGEITEIILHGGGAGSGSVPYHFHFPDTNLG
jgi:hypothetical protein